MLNLFIPHSKVQKNRLIIRKTDERMAKYSRRGIISNFLVYTLCLVFSQDFIRDHQKMALSLTVGLFVLTVMRAYFLFRFEHIYPRAPAAWRNKYFTVTLLGACWWGLIMASLTLALDMQGAAPLMWLYTVIFFSTTAHAFAPYQRFLTVYQFLGIVPAACSAFFVGDVVGVFYGALLIMFFWILNHQCELMGKAYWEHLEADYALARKTESLEEERRGTKASVSLSKDYLSMLSQVLHNKDLSQDVKRSDAPPEPLTLVSLQKKIERVADNVADFQQVSNKDLEFENKIINVRHFLQSHVESLMDMAESSGIELDTALSPVLPSRIVVDSARLSQLVQTMLKSSIEQTDSGFVLLEVEFVREFESAGELHIGVLRQQAEQRKGFFQGKSDDSFKANLDLILAKGLAEAMDGALEISDWQTPESRSLRLRLPIKLAELDTRPEYHRLEYKGRTLLLVQPNGRWLDQKRLELDTMGFDVMTAHDFKRAFQLLQEAINSGKAIESVVYSYISSDTYATQFCKELSEHNDLRYTHQFVICADSARKSFKEKLNELTPLVHFVKKPSGIFEFEIAAGQVFENRTVDVGGEDNPNKPQDRVLWLALGKNFDNADKTQSGELIIDKVGDLKSLGKLMNERQYKLLVVELTQLESAERIPDIRKIEEKQGQSSLLPIVGLCEKKDERFMLEMGADHCIAIETLIAGDTTELRYWIKGRNH